MKLVIFLFSLFYLFDNYPYFLRDFPSIFLLLLINLSFDCYFLNTTCDHKSKPIFVSPHFLYVEGKIFYNTLFFVN